MSSLARPADGERLPWLEPFAEQRRPRPARRLPLIALGLLVALAAALAGGYWLGERRALDPAPPVVPAPSPPPLPRSAAPPPPAAAPAPSVSAPPPIVAAPPAPVAAPPRPATRERPRKIRREAPPSAALDAVRAQQEPPRPAPAVIAPAPSAPPAAAPRVWPRLPSPGPAGQVIQLGAFSHPDRAYAAYRARLARYPALRSMPRVIVPVTPEVADGRMLYVLRLGTRSRAQSKSLCRSLKRRGDHCIVIG